MSKQFKTDLAVESMVTALGLDLRSEMLFSLKSICDPSDTDSYSICAYIKGPLPENKECLVLFAEEDVSGYHTIAVDNPREYMSKLIAFVQGRGGFRGERESPMVHSSVKCGDNVVIEGNVEIGEGSVIEHNSVVCAGTRIGKNCIIRANSSIGGNGYSFYRDRDGNLVNYPALGGVAIGDNVEIGHGSCIMRGTVDDTIIEDYAKLDNLVHVAHDCMIGREATITAGVTFSGYVSVGARTRIAPQAVVKQRLTIGCDSFVGLGAVVTKPVPDGATVAGNPAKKLR